MMTTTATTSAAADRAEAFVRSVVPTAVLTESFKQVRVYQVPQQDMDVARVFPRFLDKPALAVAGIQDWGLGQSSLEDVFINVCRRGVGGAVAQTQTQKQTRTQTPGSHRQAPNGVEANNEPTQNPTTRSLTVVDKGVVV